MQGGLLSRLGLRLVGDTAIVGALAGCDTTSEVQWPWTQTPPPTATVQSPTDVQYYPSDEPLRLGLEHFNRGNYGVAERFFRDAVEKAPRDVSAWIGLAGCYDRLGRFDLADRAYASAIRLTGETTAILNNQGYSYMLRGDYVRARAKLMKAYEREPGNPTIANNLYLLNGSQRAVGRAADQSTVR